MQDACFKAYPCCYCNHTAIAGIGKMVEENGIKPEEIESIVIKGDPLLLTENRWDTKVRCYSDTQFLIPYSAAIAVYPQYRPGPSWQSPTAFNDPKIIDLMKKVKGELHPEASRLAEATLKKGGIPVFFDVILEISARGKTFTAEVTSPKGFASNPVTEEELKAKYRDNASYSMITTEKSEEAMEIIGGLEKVPSMTELTNILTIGQ